MTDLALNEDQITAILSEALNRELIDNMPENKEACALELINLAKAAFNNGNRSDNVQTILFISNVDQKPLVTESIEDKYNPDIAEIDSMGATGREVKKLESSTIHNGIDLSTLSDGVVEGLIAGLDNYPPSEQVEADRKAYLAEKERRNEKAGKNQDQPQGTTAQAPGEKAGEAAPEVSPASVEGGNQAAEPHSGEVQAGGGTVTGFDNDAAGADSAKGEDAGAFARAQTPETSSEGKPAKAKAPEEDGSRTELEEQLTYDIIKAYDVDVTKIDKIPVEQLQVMIENPDGPGDKKVITDSEAEAAAITNKEVKAVAGISAQESSPERVISKEDLGIEVEETPAQNSAEESDRESLEAQLTGPTLKAYGQGRKSVPSLGINELRFMVEHPDGKVSQEELEQARSLDGTPDGETLKEADKEERDSPVRKLLEEDVQNKKETVIKGPPIEEVQAPKVKTKKWSEVRPKDIPNEAGKNRAMEIIEKEGMPIPPAYADEQAPVFPVDVSRCSREELYSFHAQFHAYETRLNYVLIEHEDKLNDCVHHKSYREAVVAKEVPFMGEDGKRNTNEYRDIQVKGDPEVLSFGVEENEARKVVNGLKTFQKNFHLSCERLSRQISKYETERQDAPR